MSTNEKPIDYVVEDEEIQKKCREIVLNGLKNYAAGDDYKLLAQNDPTLAAALVKPDLPLKFGAAPLIQILKFTGLAWGERYHYTSDNTRWVDAKIRMPFETEPKFYLLNHKNVSQSTLLTAMRFFGFFDEGIRQSDIVIPTEKNLKKILKDAGEKALDKTVEGWSGYFTSLERNTDGETIQCSDKKILYVNPVYITVPDEKDPKKKKEVEIGYIGTKESIEFYPYSLGQSAKDKVAAAKRKKKIIKSVFSTLIALGIATAIILFFVLK